MKLMTKWIALPALAATMAAVTPVDYSNGSGRLGTSEVSCMDCTKSDNHICGDPILGAKDYCTSGASWCKEPE